MWTRRTPSRAAPDRVALRSPGSVQPSGRRDPPLIEPRNARRILRITRATQPRDLLWLNIAKSEPVETPEPEALRSMSRDQNPFIVTTLTRTNRAIVCTWRRAT